MWYARDKRNGMKFPMSSLLWFYIRTKNFKRDVGSSPLRKYQKRLKASHQSLDLPHEELLDLFPNPLTFPSSHPSLFLFMSHNLGHMPKRLPP